MLKLWVDVEEELYYPSSENIGAYQLCSYCTPDLRLCFCIGKNPSHDAAHLSFIICNLKDFFAMSVYILIRFEWH